MKLVSVILENHPSVMSHFRTMCSRTDCSLRGSKTCPQVFVMNGVAVEMYGEFLQKISEIRYDGRYISVMRPTTKQKHKADYGVFFYNGSNLQETISIVEKFACTDPVW